MNGRNDGWLAWNTMAKVLISRTIPATVRDPNLSPVIDIPRGLRHISTCVRLVSSCFGELVAPRKNIQPKIELVKTGKFETGGHLSSP